MCGRFTLRTPMSVLIEQFELDLSEPADVVLPEAAVRARYNIAPTQDVVAIRSMDGRRGLSLLKWGLIPRWAKDPTIGNRLLNARADTLGDKPAFRDAFKRRRCLIPADGYYEWLKVGNAKQPCLIGMPGDGVFAFAGLWESWEPVGGARIESCTIVTTESNAATRPIHDRMPVIIAPQDYGTWLGDSAGPAAGASAVDARLLQALLRPWTGELRIMRVSSLVNKPQNETPQCIEPLVDDAVLDAGGKDHSAAERAAPKRAASKRTKASNANRRLFDDG